MTNLQLTLKEAEAVLWGLSEITDSADAPPQRPAYAFLLLLQDYRPAEILNACHEIQQNLRENGWAIAVPLTQIEKDILRLCAENTIWLGIYTWAVCNPGMQRDAQEALRTLAVKLQKLGVRSRHVPVVDSCWIDTVAS
jgi:hypothetical protein